MGRLFLPFIGGVVGTVLGVAGVFSVDLTNGRVIQMPKQQYSEANGNLSYNYRLDLGRIDIPDGKQINALWLTGQMASERGALNGVVFDLANNSPVGDTDTDPTRVRAIIGQVTTTGPGSVRGVHATAIGALGSTGAVNAINGEVHPADTTQRAYAVGVMQTGAGGIADGLFYGSREPFRYGINMAEMATYSDGTFYLPLGEQNAIVWADGTKLFEDVDGQLKVRTPSGKIKVLAP